MKIISLVENTASKDTLGAEHGLSLYIETDRHKILFDMGQSNLFEENAAKLGVNLADVDIAVLSHGHYDHGGGLKRFLEINRKAPVYISRYAFEPHYNGTEKYIGLDTSLVQSDRLIFTEDFTEIEEGLTLFSCNDRKKNYDLGSFGLTMLQEVEFLPDDFRHEQYLLIEEAGKRVLISGCSHKGIMDITEWFQPDILVGGFHFSKLPLDDTLAGYARRLNDYATKFYTCHCTGTEQFAFMKNEMEQLEYLATGQRIEV